MSFGPEPRNNPAAKDVVDEFKAKGFDPQGYTLYSYAAMQIIKQAAEKAKSLDPKKIAEYMHSGMAFNTVIGDISYDKKGDRTDDRLRLVRLEEGRRRQDHLPPDVIEPTRFKGSARSIESPPRPGGLFCRRRRQARRLIP